MGKFVTWVLMFILVFTLTCVASAAGNIKQVVLPDKSAILVTGTDVNAVEGIEGFRHELIVFTPAFKGQIEVPGLAATLVAVSKDKVTDVRTGDADAGLPAAPAIPADGYVLYGAGRGQIALSELNPGDPITIIEKPSVKPDKLSTKVVSDSGDSIDITAFDIGRGAGELIVYTPDFGTKTWTNEWGFEALVVGGEVQLVRALGDTEPFDILPGSWVVSGHDAGAVWVQANLTEGSTVTLE